MIVEKNYWGAYVVSDMVRGYRIQQTYMGYTKAQAVADFRRMIRAR